VNPKPHYLQNISTVLTICGYLNLFDGNHPEMSMKNYAVKRHTMVPQLEGGVYMAAKQPAQPPLELHAIGTHSIHVTFLPPCQNNPPKFTSLD
jgi:hypothetical protein